jgi:hypothetical protein
MIVPMVVAVIVAVVMVVVMVIVLVCHLETLFRRRADTGVSGEASRARTNRA